LVFSLSSLLSVANVFQISPIKKPRIAGLSINQANNLFAVASKCHQQMQQVSEQLINADIE
jgi:hypothetical protein